MPESEAAEAARQPVRLVTFEWSPTEQGIPDVARAVGELAPDIACVQLVGDASLRSKLLDEVRGQVGLQGKLADRLITFYRSDVVQWAAHNLDVRRHASHIDAATFSVGGEGGQRLTVLNVGFDAVGPEQRLAEMHVARRFCRGLCVVAGALCSVPPEDSEPTWRLVPPEQRMDLYLPSDGRRPDRRVGALLRHGGFRDAARVADPSRTRFRAKPTAAISGEGNAYRKHGFWPSGPLVPAMCGYSTSDGPEVQALGDNAFVVMDLDLARIT